jgi:hypothetical protein
MLLSLYFPIVIYRGCQDAASLHLVIMQEVECMLDSIIIIIVCICHVVLMTLH